MRGERLDWFRIASHQKMSIQRLQLETSSTDFVDWLTFLEMEPNMFHREDHYWASICAWIKRGIVKNPNSVRDSDHLITFISEEEQKKRDKSRGARAFFMQLCGMKKAQTNANKRGK